MTVSTRTVLVVDDEPDLRTLYELTLLREGYQVCVAEGVEDAWEQLAARHFTLVISDMRMPDGSGLDLLARLQAEGRTERMIMITAYGSPENAVQALKAGAYDYLTKPVDPAQFRRVVASATGLQDGASKDVVSEDRQGRPARTGGGRQTAWERLSGRSEAMQQVRKSIEQVARSMAPVLVHGESGTGKELVARAVHERSGRAAGPFIAVNCGAIPEHLLESEFFGYRKGAFTGAQADRDGFFQAASGGTLFLDEIGDLPLAMQSKLLRVIQERAVRPVGAVNESPVDVRIVSATHKDLAALVTAAQFRQDLFYRLNVIEVRIPPLRERVQDLPALSEALLNRVAQEAGVSPVPRLGPAHWSWLARQRFPGNVRELENLLHRALALGTLDELMDPPGQASWPPPGVCADGVPAMPERAPAVALPQAAEAVAEPAASLLERGSAEPRPVGASPAADSEPAGALLAWRLEALPSDLGSFLDRVERDILEQAMRQHGQNRTAAGAALGLSLRQMRYRLARLKVGQDEVADGEAAGDAA